MNAKGETEHQHPFRGTVRIQSDPDHLEARAVVARREDDKRVTPELVEHIARREGMKTDIDLEAVEAAMEEALQEDRDSFEAVISRGTPPTPGRPERIILKTPPIPDEMSDLAETVLAAASPPEVFRQVREPVGSDDAPAKPCNKKRGLFGLARRKHRPQANRPRTKKTHVRYVPVQIDPTLHATGFAEKGEVIAEIDPPASGVPGRTVYGKTIEPDEPREVEALVGSGAERRGALVVASVDGVVRRGVNWVDVVPCRQHRWSLEIARDKLSCYLTLQRGTHGGQLPSGDEVLSEAESLGFRRDFLLDATSIERKLERALEEGGEVKQLPITRRRDSAVEVRVSHDALTAYLTIRKETGEGRKLELTDIGAEIKKHELKGLDTERIRTDIREFMRSAQTELVDYVLVEGMPPTPEGTLQVDVHPGAVSDEERQRIVAALAANPMLTESTVLADALKPDEIGKVLLVDAEELVLTIRPDATGEPGRDVYGRPIPPDTGDHTLTLYGALERKGDLVIAREAGAVDVREGDEAVVLRHRPHQDAQVRPHLSRNRMAGYVDGTPVRGTGKPLKPKEIREQCEEAGMLCGIDSEALQEVADSLASGEELHGHLVAHGEPATSGAGPAVLVTAGLERHDPQPGAGPRGAMAKITSVSAGQVVAVVFRNLDRRTELDVAGRERQVQSPENAILHPGNNVTSRERKDGREFLVAESDGEVIVEDTTVHVVLMHRVTGDVGLQSGNIQFQGMVQVDGSVTKGYYVMAGGDLLVKKTVEAALVSSDAELRIDEGFKGGGKGVARTKGSFAARFAEHGTILAVGDVYVEYSMLHCRVKCNGKLQTGSEDSRIVGGTIKAKFGGEMTELGNHRETKTYVSFGQDYLIEDQIEKLQRRIDRLKEQIAVADRKADEARQLGNDDAEPHNRQAATLRKKLRSFELKVFTLRERFEQHFDSEVRVAGTIHPGVIFESHGRTYEVSRPLHRASVYFDLESASIKVVEGTNGQPP